MSESLSPYTAAVALASQFPDVETAVSVLRRADVIAGLERRREEMRQEVARLDEEIAQAHAEFSKMADEVRHPSVLPVAPLSTVEAAEEEGARVVQPLSLTSDRKRPAGSKSRTSLRKRARKGEVRYLEVLPFFPSTGEIMRPRDLTEAFFGDRNSKLTDSMRGYINSLVAHDLVRKVAHGKYTRVNREESAVPGARRDRRSRAG